MDSQLWSHSRLLLAVKFTIVTYAKVPTKRDIDIKFPKLTRALLLPSAGVNGY